MRTEQERMLCVERKLVDVRCMPGRSMHGMIMAAK
jgi:hypothetical protein